MAVVVLFTESYPFGGYTEPNFVGPEIAALAAEFDRVIIAPVLVRGPMAGGLPANVTVDTSLTRRPGAVDKAASLARPSLYRHLACDYAYIHTVAQLRSAVAFSAYTVHYRTKIRRLISKYGLDLRTTLFYTFWFEYQAAALAGISGARFITRAHGHDIYDSESPFLSHSWREHTLSRALACYPASDSGTAYIRADYPAHAGKVATRHLGSVAPDGVNPPALPDDSDVTLLSVARVELEKGVLRQLGCVKHWARLYPQRRVRWIHVGDGSEMESLRRQAAEDVPANLDVELCGALPNSGVRAILGGRHVDFVVMMSRSEGGRPIALCEALSYGVPVIASGVGGVPEIIDAEVGALLSPAPVPEEFVSAADAAMPRRQAMRAAALERWRRDLDAEPLRRAFAREIRGLVP